MVNRGEGNSGSGRGSLLVATLAGTLGTALVLVLLYLLVLRDEPEASEQVTASTSTVTVTAPASTVTVAAPPTTVSTITPAATASSSTTGAAPVSPAIGQVRVITERGGRGHLVGPDMYQATTFGTAGVVFRWRSIDVSGDEVWAETCQVVSTVAGPGGYGHTDRSAECSGRVRENELVLDTPGGYTITTTVIGPDGATTVGTAGFEVIPK